VQRIRRKHHHGVLLQEILDEAARHGLVFYPYYISAENVPAQGTGEDNPVCRIRLLNREDASELERITMLKTPSTTAAAFAARMKRARCLGTFVDGELAAYCWIGHDGLPTPGSGRQWLFRFQQHEVCLFDVYVAPAFRGQRIAATQRRFVQRMLSNDGIQRCFSTVLAFNSASRRYKSRFFVVESELRLYVHIRLWRLPGIDVRLWRKDNGLPTPRLKVIAARRR